MGRSAARTAAGAAHGFPAALTSFVGRAGTVTEVAGLLDQHRLVTVTRPGGAGKTRLAGEVAKEAAGRFADGVWLAELAAVRDPAQVPAVAAAALGIPEQPGVATADALARALARRQLLLVLDNCEQVIGAVAVLCAGLLPACDDVRILATSREPLRVAGEARYRLAPLTLPGPDHPADPGGSEAVALFADRARLADAGFTLDAETGPVVARLVARLDGMPLAIELAAARVEVLGVTQLLDRIGDRLGLLVAGDRLAARRQRSLAATVEWSYRLLDDDEQRVFRAVSVFPGPFTLAAAEVVAGAGAGPAVLRLVDCSLLVPPRAGPDGRSRYVMLETLRAYGTERLAEAGEHDAAAATLAGYALRIAEEAMAGWLAGAEEVAAARWLDAEAATMRQTLEWAVQHDASVAPRLAAALGWWWQVRGFERQAPLREARRALGPARARAAEARGAAMSLATAAEYALLLTAADLPLAGEPGGTPAGEPGGTLGGAPGGTPAGAPGGTLGGTLGGAPGERLPGSRAERWAGRRRRPGSAPGNGSWSSWSPGGRPTRRSPPSCSSACVRSAPTWTASATRPAAGGAPTSPAWPSPPAWCSRPHP